LADAVVANIFEEEIAEGYVRDLFSARTCDGMRHLTLVGFIRARVRKQHRPERQIQFCRLRLNQFTPHGVHGDAIGSLVEGCEEAHHLRSRLGTKAVERPRAVFPRAP